MNNLFSMFSPSRGSKAAVISSPTPAPPQIDMKMDNFISLTKSNNPNHYSLQQKTAQLALMPIDTQKVWLQETKSKLQSVYDSDPKQEVFNFFILTQLFDIALVLLPRPFIHTEV